MWTGRWRARHRKLVPPTASRSCHFQLRRNTDGCCTHRGVPRAILNCYTWPTKIERFLWALCIIYLPRGVVRVRGRAVPFEVRAVALCAAIVFEQRGGTCEFRVKKLWQVWAVGGPGLERWRHVPALRSLLVGSTGSGGWLGGVFGGGEFGLGICYGMAFLWPTRCRYVEGLLSVGLAVRLSPAPRAGLYFKAAGGSARARTRRRALWWLGAVSGLRARR